MSLFTRNQPSFGGVSSGTQTSVSATSTTVTPSGDLVVVWFVGYGITSPSVSDSAGNPYVQGLSESSGGYQIYMYWSFAPNSGTLTVTATSTASTYLTISVGDFSTNGLIPVVLGTHSANGTTMTPNSGSITLNRPALFLGCVCPSTAYSGGYTAGTNFTLDSYQQANIASTQVGIATEYNLDDVASSDSASFTLGSSIACAAAAIAFGAVNNQGFAVVYEANDTTSPAYGYCGITPSANWMASIVSITAYVPPTPPTPAPPGTLLQWICANNAAYSNAAGTTACTNGSSAVTLQDLSGNGRDWVAGTAPEWLSAQVNGLPALYFNSASDQYMKNLCEVDGLTLMVVCTISPAASPVNQAIMAADCYPLQASQFAYEWLHNVATNGGASYTRGSVGSALPAVTWGAGGGAYIWQIMGVRTIPGSTPQIAMYTGGLQIGSQSATATLNAINVNYTYIGCTSVAGTRGNYGQFYVAESVTIPSSSSNSTIQGVLAYYCAKYNFATGLQKWLGSTFNFTQNPTSAPNANKIVVQTSADLLNWQYVPTTVVGCPAGHSQQDCNMVYIPSTGLYWCAVTSIGSGGANPYIDLYSSPGGSSLGMPCFVWTYQYSVNYTAAIGTGGYELCAAPRWFFDADGTVHLTCQASATYLQSGNRLPFEVHPVPDLNPTAAQMTGTWSTPVQITGTGFPTSVTDPFPLLANSIYYFFFKNAANDIGVAKSTSGLLSGFATDTSYTTWSAYNQYESPLVVPTANGYTLYTQGVNTMLTASLASGPPDGAYAQPTPINDIWTGAHGQICGLMLTPAPTGITDTSISGFGTQTVTHLGAAVYTDLTATGTNQATAVALCAPESLAEFGTVPSGTGVYLGCSRPGAKAVIQNSGANALTIYPVPGGTVAGTFTYSLASGASISLRLFAPGVWHQDGGLGVSDTSVSATYVATANHVGVAVYTELTATGTNQATAVPLCANEVLAEFDTVPAGTGVYLGCSKPGAKAVIQNSGANALTVYPAPGGTVVGSATYSLASGASISLRQFAPGVWHQGT